MKNSKKGGILDVAIGLTIILAIIKSIGIIDIAWRTVFIPLMIGILFLLLLLIALWVWNRRD